MTAPADAMGGEPIRVLLAPDSFKGSLSSVEVARALADGWGNERPRDVVSLRPLADGGEGTLAAIEAAGGWERRTARVADPLGRAIDAAWLLSLDGSTAFVEMAAASGLSRVGAGERDPVRATSRGTGELIRAALQADAHEVVVGIGGSATSDGGRGLLEALGLSVGADGAVDLSGLDPRLASTGIRVACDVTNPLLGPHGAAAIYGPQKGATAAQVAELDARNARWADALEGACGCDERDTAGAGAAGGVGFALLCIADRVRSFALRPGVELVMETVGFDERLALADLVITGEGRIDAQTAFGKTALGVARRARDRGVRCIAVGGGVTPEGVAALASVGAEVVPVWEREVPVEEAIAAGRAPIVACGERLARAESARTARPGATR